MTITSDDHPSNLATHEVEHLQFNRLHSKENKKHFGTDCGTEEQQTAASDKCAKTTSIIVSFTM